MKVLKKNSMPKSSIIYGANQAVKLITITFPAIENVIKTYIGDAPVHLEAAQAIVKKAKAEFKQDAPKAYVKVGVARNNLVLRCKLERRILPTIELDAILVRDWTEFVAANPAAPASATASATTPWTNGIKRQAAELDEDEEEEEGEATPADSAAVNLAPSASEQSDPPAEAPPRRQESEEEKLARQARLREVLQRPREGGESLADHFKRAAAKAAKLGMTRESQARMAEQGLQPMHEAYRGEVLDHQKNRYGRFLGPMPSGRRPSTISWRSSRSTRPFAAAWTARRARGGSPTRRMAGCCGRVARAWCCRSSRAAEPSIVGCRRPEDPSAALADSLRSG